MSSCRSQKFKKSRSGDKFFDTEQFNIITNTTVGKKSLTSVCYTDVTATKVLDINGNPYITFDFTQQNGDQYDETYETTYGILNRSKTFFRDIIRTYLLSNEVSCDYIAIGIESCAPPLSG